MRINIKPVEVNGQVTDVAEVSLALSSSVAIRIVPVVDDVPVESAGFGLVGAAGDPAVDILIASVAEALAAFVVSRGA